MSFAKSIPALAILERAAEIRQASAPGATLVDFEETTTAQKVDPIGRAWAEFYGWRPPHG